MFFYVVSRTYAEIFSLLRVCSGLLSNTPGLVIERLHLIFCKYILSLNKCTYTNMVYGETGEIPVKCRMIKIAYWCRFITCRTRKLSYFLYKFNIVYTQIISTTLRGYYLLRTNWQSQTIPTGIDLFNNNILQRLRDQ